MYCSICGAHNTTGRDACQQCGAPLGPYDPRFALASRERAAAPRQMPTCPRCGYEGTGITYFSRGSHVAALVGATVLTAGMMGAGGIVYYLMRRDHRVCPRCGRGWGRFGERAVLPVHGGRGAAADLTPSRERMKRGGSVMLYLFAALMLVISVGAGEAVPAMLAMMAGLGGFALQRSALTDRDARRAALVSSLQLPVLKLASERGGRLTVSQVAAELGWPIRRAEKVLQSLDDGVRVDSEVTDEGVIVFEFRELLDGRGPGGPPRLMEG